MSAAHRYPSGPKEVAARFDAAEETRRRMPNDRGPSTPTSADLLDLADGDQKRRNWPPSALEITMADECQRWLSWLDYGDAKLVALASAMSFREAAAEMRRCGFQCSTGTAQRRYWVAMGVIAQHLRKGHTPPATQEELSAYRSEAFRKRHTGVRRPKPMRRSNDQRRGENVV